MSGRKREKAWSTTQEDAALDNIAQRAEEVLQEKKREREKARKMRMDELEKKQKEEDNQLDKQYDLLQKVGATGSTTRVYSSLHGHASSYAGSMDSDSDGKDLKTSYSELDEKYRRAMVGNCQLDNEKQAVCYQVDLLKDRLEDAEEHCHELEREAHDKHRMLGEERRHNKDLQWDLERLKVSLKYRDDLIRKHGFVTVDTEVVVQPSAVAKGKCADAASDISGVSNGESESPIFAALVSIETAEMLRHAAPGTLDEKIKSFIGENVKLKAEIKNIRSQMDEERDSRRASPRPAVSVSPTIHANGFSSTADVQLAELQRESARQLTEYKSKILKAENDVASLESSVARLEVQVKRFKEMAEESEKTEDELKLDKRKLQKQLREAQQQIEELESQKKHLQNRLDKIRQARKEVLGNSS